MPISKDLFDQEIDEIDEQIIDFLNDSPDEAFSLEELVAGVGLTVVSMRDEAGLMERMDDLINARHIESRNIHGVMYFSAT